MAASAFSLTLAVPSSGFDVTAGNPVVGGLHGPTRHFFCPRCISWMFCTRPEGMDEFVNLRPSMLDDHRWFVPFIEVWTQERLAWASTPAVHSFATQPLFEDYAKLIEEFAREGARADLRETDAKDRENISPTVSPRAFITAERDMAGGRPQSRDAPARLDRQPTFPQARSISTMGDWSGTNRGIQSSQGASDGPGNRSDRRHAAYWGEWSQMNRRGLLQRAAVAIQSLSGMWSWLGPTRVWGAARPHFRVRPGDPGWPSDASWNRLSREVGGRLVEVRSPLAGCAAASSSPDATRFQDLKNPYYFGDEVGLTQSLGWVDAWTSRPSAYAVAARTTAMSSPRSISPASTICGSSSRAAATATRAHRTRRLPPDLDAGHERGHAARRVRRRRLRGARAPQPAVTAGAGAMWGQVYDAVTTRAARYVQGGGA